MSTQKAFDGPTGRAPRGHGLSKPGLHGIIVLLGWLVFAASWVKVSRGVGQHTVTVTLLLITAVSVVSFAITGWWILHNRRIFRRKGPRNGTRVLSFEASEDFLGRSLVADWSEVQHSQTICVAIHHDRKWFIGRGAVSET